MQRSWAENGLEINPEPFKCGKKYHVVTLRGWLQNFIAFEWLRSVFCCSKLRIKVATIRSSAVMVRAVSNFNLTDNPQPITAIVTRGERVSNKHEKRPLFVRQNFTVILNEFCRFLQVWLNILTWTLTLNQSKKIANRKTLQKKTLLTLN